MQISFTSSFPICMRSLPLSFLQWLRHLVQFGTEVLREGTRALFLNLEEFQTFIIRYNVSCGVFFVDILFLVCGGGVVTGN